MKQNEIQKIINKNVDIKFRTHDVFVK